MSSSTLPIREDPPAANGRWESVLEPLRKPERIGVWFLIRQADAPYKAHITASALTRGKYRTPPGRWEFTSRKVGEEGRVYARYLGPEPS